MPKGHRDDITDGAKQCPRCQQRLPLSAFGKDRHRAHGYMAWCKLCHNARQTEMRTPSVMREKNKKRAKKWRANNPDKFRNQWLRKYGITNVEYDARLTAQGRKCAICGRAHLEETRRRLHVDHCHSTAVVRGLLCFPCNVSLGYFNHDVQRLLAAIRYLSTKTG